MWRRGKPVSQAGTEVWGPLGLLSEEELAWREKGGGRERGERDTQRDRGQRQRETEKRERDTHRDRERDRKGGGREREKLVWWLSSLILVVGRQSGRSLESLRPACPDSENRVRF